MTVNGVITTLYKLALVCDSLIQTLLASNNPIETLLGYTTPFIVIMPHFNPINSQIYLKSVLSDDL
jgi:hypothetical protein